LGVRLDLAMEAKDAFEGGKTNNGTVSGASQFVLDADGHGAANVLTIHKGSDVDWYKFTVPYGTTGTATLQMTNVQNGLQGHLAVYASSRGGVPLVEAAAANPNETVTLNMTGLKGGTTYYMEARGLNWTTGIYDLDIAVAMLAPDGHEANNDKASATDLTAAVAAGNGAWNEAGLSVHRAWDEDWFRLDAPANTDGDLVVTIANPAGGLAGTVTVYQEVNGTLKSVGSGSFGSKGVGGLARVTNAKPGTTYYIKVDNNLNETGGYDLGVQLELEISLLA
jgi:hypothetical protein